MGSGMGYKYDYRFLMDDDIIHRYGWLNIKEDIKFLFEFRTKFTVKWGDSGNEIIDSEKFQLGAEESKSDGLFGLMYMRLGDYWFSDEEMTAFTDDASAFAGEMAAHPRNASRRVIPIAVELDVCTVQQPGETVSDAIGRAIKSDNIYPSSLERDNSADHDKSEAYHEMVYFLRGELSPEYRVYNVDWMTDVMEECRICGRKPRIGDQITVLQNYCGHAFHYHCIVGRVVKDTYLLTDTSCPVCAHPIARK